MSAGIARLWTLWCGIIGLRRQANVTLLTGKPNPMQEAEMKSHTEYLVMETRKRREMVHITDEVEQIVRRSGVKDGLCFVSPMHITAAVYVNDLESGLIEDIGKWLEELAPARPDYRHHQTGEDNGDAHLKSL